MESPPERSGGLSFWRYLRGVWRGSFELHCPADGLKLSLLKTEGFAPPIPWTIGVEGCAQQAMYTIVYGSGWVLSSHAQAAR